MLTRPSLSPLQRQGALMLLCAAAGLGGGWLLWHPRAPVLEPSAPAVRQHDSSLVLERAPDARARPAQQIPKGGTVERIVRVVVQPKPVVIHDTLPPRGVTIPDPGQRPVIHGDTVLCPAVRVDLTLVRMRDQTRRVVASSPDGTVIGGVDIPVEPVAPTRVLRWAAGGVWNAQARTYGAFVDRDLGPLRLGVAAVQQVKGTIAPLVAEVRVGLRF